MFLRTFIITFEEQTKKNKMSERKLEICCYSLQAAIDAQNGGADRIELCQSRPEGGTTPSYATVQMAKKLIHIPIYVMIRPRGGDFLYSDLEFEIMMRDIEMCKNLKVDGVVFGLLLKDGSIDIERTIKLTELARPMKVTFHRAFDMANNLYEALTDLINIGIDSILTSGGAQTAIEGKVPIKDLVAKAGEQLVIIPGSGIDETNIREMATFTAAKEFHSSAKLFNKGKIEFINPKVRLSDANQPQETGFYETDINKIRKMKNLLKNI